jgi:SAM-dependent methyltransferase
MWIKRFFRWNKRVADAFWEKCGYSDRRLYHYYEEKVRSLLKKGMLVYDVGGGGECCYADGKASVGDFRIVGVDIEDVRLKENSTVDEMIVTDITKSIPLPYGQIDMLTSCSVLKHLSDQTAFVRNACGALKDGGLFVSVFPSKFALFALINRMLSNRLARKILFYIYPNLIGANGFRVYYDKTYYTRFRRLLEENGFTVLELKCNYYQSDYFGFFLPFYFLSLLWDAFCRLFRIKNLCSQLCVTAVKNPSGGVPGEAEPAAD